MPEKLMATWFHFLEDLSIAEYKKLTLADYIEHTKNTFLPQNIQGCIERLQDLELEPDFFADLLLLAFVYRNISSAFCDKVNFLFEKPAPPSESHSLNDEITPLHEHLKNKPSLKYYQKNVLKDEAMLIKEKMKQYAAKAVRRQRKNRKNKREDLFREILKKSQKNEIDGYYPCEDS